MADQLRRQRELEAQEKAAVRTGGRGRWLPCLPCPFTSPAHGRAGRAPACVVTSALPRPFLTAPVPLIAAACLRPFLNAPGSSFLLQREAEKAKQREKEEKEEAIMRCALCWGRGWASWPTRTPPRALTPARPRPCGPAPLLCMPCWAAPLSLFCTICVFAR